MVNTSPVTVWIDTDLKDSAEGILAKQGITPNSAVQMLYSQIVLRNGIPFDPCFTTTKPTAIGGMTRAELEAELWKGIDSLADGRVYSVEEVDKMFEQDFEAW